MKSFFVAAVALMSINAFAESAIQTDTFKLYREPNHVVTPLCDVYTHLTLDYVAGTISLENKVAGVCELYVMPKKRVYEMADRERDGCGSVVYAGPVKTTSGNDASVKYVDNSSRVCDDVFVSNIIVTETDTAGVPHVLYGNGSQR